MTQEQADKHELGLALDMMDRRIESAGKAKCSDQGHQEVVESLGDFADCFRHLSDVVERLPHTIADRVRDDVLTLIQAHASDAVVRAIAARVPESSAATPGWREIARRFCATMASSPWGIFGVVALLAVSPTLRELAIALVEAVKK